MFKDIYVYFSMEINMINCGFDEFYGNVAGVNANVKWVLDENGAAVMKREISQKSQITGCEDVLVITDATEEFEGGVCVIGYGLSFRGSSDFIIENLSAVSPKFLELVYARHTKKPYTVLETERLLVREMTVEDLPNMYKLYETLKDCEYVEPLYEYEEEMKFTINYINNMYKFFWYGLWLVFEKDSKRLVGRAGLENRQIDGNMKTELGYLIGKPWQNKGYATEVTKAIIEYAGEELAIEELFVCSDKNNKPSISLAQKLGFAEYASDVDGMNIYYKRL